MNRTLLLTTAALLAPAAPAQGITPDLLLTFSQNETTLSGSGGTVLQAIRRNEVALLRFSMPCPVSAEKWAPRTVFHVMAGDEDGDGTYFEPALFGSIDALLAPTVTPAGSPNHSQRDVFWSPSTAMGTNISLQPLRPGDVGRIRRLGFGDGQVQYFMRQEQFNLALGLPPATPIDIDAIAFSPNFGVFFSLDSDIVANTACGSVLVRDGDILCVPPMALTLTPDLRVAAVLPNSAVVIYTEAQMDVFVANAGIADRFGVCVNAAVDVEALEIDWAGPTTAIATCTGMLLFVPSLIFATETLTGGGLLTTAGGGTIYATPCGLAGTPCGLGPTLGNQVGLMPPSAAMGIPSHVNAITGARTLAHVLEPQQHVLSVFPGGAPPGSTQIDYGSPFAFNIALIEIVSPIVPASIPAFPFSLLCFPDLYAPSLIFFGPLLPGTWGSFPMVGIPPLWTGKVLFQTIGFGGSGFELSTPAVIDVQ